MDPLKACRNSGFFVVVFLIAQQKCSFCSFFSSKTNCSKLNKLVKHMTDYSLGCQGNPLGWRKDYVEVDTDSRKSP